MPGFTSMKKSEKNIKIGKLFSLKVLKKARFCVIMNENIFILTIRVTLAVF